MTLGIQEKIITTVKDYFGVDIFQDTRQDKIVWPRQTCMYLLWNIGEMGTVDIGKLFNRDHSCVTSAKKKVIGLCQVNPEVRKQIIELESKLE